MIDEIYEKLGSHAKPDTVASRKKLYDGINIEEQDALLEKVSVALRGETNGKFDPNAAYEAARKSVAQSTAEGGRVFKALDGYEKILAKALKNAQKGKFDKLIKALKEGHAKIVSEDKDLQKAMNALVDQK